MQTVCASTASVAIEVLIEFIIRFSFYNLFICQVTDCSNALVFFA